MDYSLIEQSSENLLRENTFSQISQYESDLENSNLFPVAVQKAKNFKRKALLFRNQVNIDTYLLCDPRNLYHANFSHPRLGRLTKVVASNYQELVVQLGNIKNPSIVILTNNVLAKIGVREFRELAKKATKCLFIVHDYDCHHWRLMSAQCMLLSDLYIPAHYQTSNINRLLCNSRNPQIPIGSIQWDYQFLTSRIDLLCKSERPIVIKGKHSLYSNFPYRNKLIATFNQHFKEICFTDSTAFHELSQAEKFHDWQDTLLHFIAPVSSDVPIRVFDALVTGGIPVVPFEMEASLSAYGIDSRHYLTYGIDEIANPIRAVQEWAEFASRRSYEEKFDQITRAITNLHINHITYRVFEFCIQSIDKNYQAAEKSGKSC